MYVYRPIWFVNKKNKRKEKRKIWSIVTVTVTICKHLQTVKACIINDIGFVAITGKKIKLKRKIEYLREVEIVGIYGYV